MTFNKPALLFLLFTSFVLIAFQAEADRKTRNRKDFFSAELKEKKKPRLSSSKRKVRLSNRKRLAKIKINSIVSKKRSYSKGSRHRNQAPPSISISKGDIQHPFTNGQRVMVGDYYDVNRNKLLSDFDVEDEWPAEFTVQRVANDMQVVPNQNIEFSSDGVNFAYDSAPFTPQDCTEVACPPSDPCPEGASVYFRTESAAVFCVKVLFKFPTMGDGAMLVGASCISGENCNEEMAPYDLIFFNQHYDLDAEEEVSESDSGADLFFFIPDGETTPYVDRRADKAVTFLTLNKGYEEVTTEDAIIAANEELFSYGERSFPDGSTSTLLVHVGQTYDGLGGNRVFKLNWLEHTRYMIRFESEHLYTYNPPHGGGRGGGSKWEHYEQYGGGSDGTKCEEQGLPCYPF